MTLPTYYATGSASVNNGATTITFAGALLGTADFPTFKPGDLFLDPAQPLVPGQRLTSVDYVAGTAELWVGWPGTSMTADPYEVRFVEDGVRSTAQTRRLLEQLSVVEANGRGLFYRFATPTVDADPGAGYLRFNHATIGSATSAYLDNLDANGGAVSTVLDTWDDFGASGGRGQLWVRSVATPSTFYAFNVTGSVVDGMGYRKLMLSYIGGAGALLADDELMVDFVPVGPAGAADDGVDGVDGKFSGTEVIKTAAYTALAADVGRTIILNKATADTLSFEAAATLGSTWMVMVKNIGAGTWSLDPSGAETIDGTATTTLKTGQSLVVASNGSGLRTFFLSSVGREVLTADRTYFVRPDGSDSNTGLVDSAGGAFLTIAKAVAVVAALDLSIYNATIDLADATWNADVVVAAPWVGSGTVTLQGNTGTPANVTVNGTTNAIKVTGSGARLTLTGITITSSGSGIVAENGGQITLGAGMVFGACAAGFHMIASGPGAVINGSSTSYSITGAAARHLSASPSGYINLFNAPVTLSGSLNFSSAFAYADREGFINAGSASFTGGTITGVRFAVASNAVINTSGAGRTLFPGNADGTVSGGGAYDGETEMPAVTVTTDYSVLGSDTDIILNKGSAGVLTLPSAVAFFGRRLWLRTIQAVAWTSASSNVVPRIGGSAGTAILPATDGAWCMLKSNGINWEIMASGV